MNKIPIIYIETLANHSKISLFKEYSNQRRKLFGNLNETNVFRKICLSELILVFAFFAIETLETCYYMYRRRTKKIIWRSLLAGLLLLIACSGDVLDSPLVDKGSQESHQGLYLTEQKSITVIVDMPSEVKVYSNTGKSYRLVGQYSNITGKKKMNFFAEKDANDFRVSVNGKTLSITNGGVANFKKNNENESEMDD